MATKKEGGKRPKTVQFDKLLASLPANCLQGKAVAITGTTSGTGAVAARACLRFGVAHLIVLNRPSDRAALALQELQGLAAELGGSSAVTAVPCDLMSLEDVRRAGAEVLRIVGDNGLDVLCNNAGIMGFPDEATVDGYDVQMQVNHLSHFLLTNLLWPALLAAGRARGEARVVNHSSEARKLPSGPHKPEYFGKNGGQLGGNGAGLVCNGPRYQRYHQTKLANCTFTYKLASLVEQAGLPIKVLVAHPGGSTTSLQTTSRSSGGMSKVLLGIINAASQSAEDGTCGILRCICDPEAKSGDFYGPHGAGLRAFAGPAVHIKPEKELLDQRNWAVMWEGSEAACGPFVLQPQDAPAAAPEAE